jgi:hypothetical protein
MDLQLPMQSMPVTTNVLSSNPIHGEVYSIHYYEIKFVRDLRSKIDTPNTNMWCLTFMAWYTSIKSLDPTKTLAKGKQDQQFLPLVRHPPCFREAWKRRQ